MLMPNIVFFSFLVPVSPAHRGRTLNKDIFLAFARSPP